MTSIPVLPRISDYVAWHASHTPDAEALVLDKRRLTYADFARAVDRLACALVACGVQPGDRVATLQTPTPEYLIAFAATASVGAIWMGLNPKYRTSELKYVVSDADPSVLLTRTTIGDRTYEEEIAAMRAAAPSLQHIVTYDNNDAFESFESFVTRGEVVEEANLADRRRACGGRQACLLVYTSGTTGRPKGALLHHEGIVNFSLEQNRLWPVEPYRSLNFLPINHVGCTVDLASPCLVAGGTMVFMEQFDAAGSVRAIEHERLTFLASVPSVFALQIATPDFEETDFSSVQLIVWEGAAVSSEVLSRLSSKCRLLATNYGMTETTSAMAVVEPTNDRNILLNSVGLPFPGVEVRVVAEGREVDPGQVGEVQARSSYNFLGYWRRPEATAEAFTEDNFFRTGDLAERRPDGGLRIVGRLKEMFKSGGYNVYPREVEEVLEEHPSVALAAVVPAPDPLWQEVGVAFLIPKSSCELDEEVIFEWCRAKLANYKVPKRCIIRQELPLLPIGKVDKVELRKQAVALS